MCSRARVRVRSSAASLFVSPKIAPRVESATSKLDDTQLAEVLNWCIENFSASSLIDGGYLPYTAEEVGRLRQSPLQEIDNTRAEVLAEIARLSE